MRRDDIQGMRAVAVLLVVVFHVREWIPGGFLGVDVFFVISGFVITSMLRDQVRRGHVSIGAFFARRVRRLLPLLAVTLTLTTAAGFWLLSPLGPADITAKTAVAAALLNANTYLARQSQDYFALPADANALLHTWSLSVEEQFYLVVPFLVAGAAAVWRRGGRQVARRQVMALMAVAAIASFALFVVLSRGAFESTVQRFGFTSSPALAFYAAPARAWEFLAGAMLALGSSAVAGWNRTVRTVAGAAGLATIVICSFLYEGADGLSGPALVVPVLGTVALLAAGVGGDHPVGRLLSTRIPVTIGDLSYGWYLFHWPLIVFVEANTDAVALVVVAAVASLLLAFPAKRFIEDPFRYGERWSGGRVVALGLGCAALPVLMGLGVVFADRQFRIDELDATTRVHIDSENCNERLVDGVDPGSTDCTWEVDGAVGRIVLIGDSHASMWAESLIAAGNDLGYDVSVVTMSGCPPLLDITRRSEGEVDTECAEFMARSVDRIVELQPELVLLGSGSTGVLSPAGDSDWQGPDGDGWSREPDRVAELWEAGWTAVADRLGPEGITTVILHDVPYHPVTTATCGRLLFMVDPQGCASTRTRAEVEADRELSLGVEDRVDAADESVVSIDPIPWLCDDRSCSTYLDGTWMYRDGDHLSVAGAESLVDPVRDALSELLG